MRTLRCLVVFAGLTGAGLLVSRLLLPMALAPATRFDESLVRVCSMALLGCTGWAWAAATAVVAEAVRAVPERVAMSGWVPSVLRRTVLAACGVAVLAGMTSPARAAPEAGPPSGPRTAVGLPFPSRAMDDGLPAVAPPGSASTITTPAAVTPAATASYVSVAPGDSLWAIAARRLPPTATKHDIAAAWQQLYECNRDVIGDDPGFIQPGQRLALPEILGR